MDADTIGAIYTAGLFFCFLIFICCIAVGFTAATHRNWMQSFKAEMERREALARLVKGSNHARPKEDDTTAK